MRILIIIFLYILFPTISFAGWIPTADAPENIVGTACLPDGVYHGGDSLSCGILDGNYSPPRWSKSIDEPGCDGPYERTIEFRCVEVSLPTTCTNNVKDPDEIGIDCGGSCLASCTSVCPPGTYVYESFGSCSNASDYFAPSGCVGLVPKNSSGLCPPGTYSDAFLGCDPSVPGETPCDSCCNYSVASVQVSSTFDPNTLPAPSGPSAGGTFSVAGDSTSTKGPSTTTTNGDTTTTATTKTTTTTTYNSASNDKYESTSTKTTYLTFNSTTGETTETETESVSISIPGPPQAEYDPAVTVGERFSERFATFVIVIKGSDVLQPLFATFNPNLGSGNPVFEIPLGSYGSFSFDLSDYDGAWSAMYYCMIFLGMLVSARLILANK